MQQYTSSAFRILLLLFSVFYFPAISHAQDVPVHLSSVEIYSFIDELANAGLVTVNSAIKPYSRNFISKALEQADGQREKLNSRQQKDLDFFLLDFGKELHASKDFKRRLDLFYYKDSIFSITVNPILGVQVFHNDSGNFYHRWNGAEAWAYAGHFGFYASLRDNHESKRLSDPAYLNQFTASNYKVDTKGGGDFDEFRGGITYAWKWGSAGLVKDHFAWGDNYHGSNIFSGNVPSFTQLKFHVNPVPWFDFNYVHGWLVSDVIDSSRSWPNGSATRITYRYKFMAANMFSFTPWKKLILSFGNSIVYSDEILHPAYFIPFGFFKTIDHSLNSTGSNFLGQNSQLFFNVSSRNIRNVHLYSSLFVDEIALGRATDADKQSNYLSFKIGAHTSNLGLQNLELTAEYTRTNPFVYTHYISTATFANSSFNMGHYLGDNAQEVYLAVAFHPISKLKIELSWFEAQKGEEYPYTGQSRPKGSTNGTLFDGDGLGNPFLEYVLWTGIETGFHARYEVLNDCRISLGLTMSDYHAVDPNILQTYTQPEFLGKQTTIDVGLSVGF